MANVKVFVTDRQRDGRTDRRMRFNVPALSQKRGTKMEERRVVLLQENRLNVS